MCKLKKMSADAGSYLGSTLGWALAIFMGLSASMFAWLVPLFDISGGNYLIGCGVVSLALAVWILRGITNHV